MMTVNTSPLVRGAWIEMHVGWNCTAAEEVAPRMGVWIEIPMTGTSAWSGSVAPRMRGVD